MIERYLKSKKDFNPIMRVCSEPLPSPIEEVVTVSALEERIMHAASKERAQIIREGFSTGDPEIQRCSARAIRYAPEKEQSELEKDVARVVAIGFLKCDRQYILCRNDTIRSRACPSDAYLKGVCDK